MEYLLKVSAVITIFYIIYKVFLQRDTFFESNRGFLLLGLLVSFSVPFLIIPIYTEYTPVSAPISITSYDNSLDSMVVESKAIAEPFNILDYLPLVYVIGVIFFFIRFAIQLISLSKLIFKNKSERQSRLKFIKTSSTISPFSFFNWVVYNPDQFNDTELNQIITHEKVHAQQYHSIDILLAQISCIILWFNPFIWLYNKSIKQNLEFIADHITQCKLSCKKSYQTTLLKTSMPSHQMALSNNFYNSLIKKRIIMLHKSKSKKINLIKYAFVIPLLTIFLMSFNTSEVYVENPNLTSDTNTSLAQGVTSKNDIERFFIHNNFTDDKLEAFKTELKSKGFDFSFKELSRDHGNIITSIFLKVSKHGVHGEYRVSSHNPLETVVIEYHKTEKKFIINTLNFIEAQKRNSNNRDLIEIIIDNNTTISELVNKKKLLKEKHGIIFNFKVSEEKSAQNNDIPIFSYQIGKKGAMHGLETTPDNSLAIQYDPKTNSIFRHGINKNGDPTYGNVLYLDKQMIHLITRDYNAKSLKNISERLKEKDITATFTNVKRNDKGDIISVQIDAKSKYGHVEYNPDSGKPITPIAVSYFGKGKGLKIGPAPLSKDFNRKLSKASSKKNKIVLSSNDTFIANSKPGSGIIDELIKTFKGKAIYILDGNEITEKELRSIDENAINSINLLKDKSATKKYGDKGKNGVIEITTKKQKNKKIIFSGISNNAHPLYIIDGKEIKKEEVEDIIDHDDIETIRVIKNKSDIKKYGDKGKNGVVEITTKKEKNKKIIFSEINGNAHPLYILDGKEVKKEDLENTIDHDDIEAIKIIKNKSDLKKYGDKGKNGVVEITTKKE
ncbi:M56 family metallopeptidase [Flavivirga eckloniae]|uniref:Peptidase M56 domain-containing protein n=1 Tax=Flavivirga eckloniae TaxID=1803846 RepID=A0A2K9PV69_9FLAO|nr:M56 family metallopeptidase [Flavivirga eckloniae]AUP80965.1 hypothetical protein C1H87_20520 [Flavivirga eckloniae]